MILSLRSSCLGPCGTLDSALSTDAPTRRSPSNWRDGPWTRWAQMDRDAERHVKIAGHPTRVSAGVEK